MRLQDAPALKIYSKRWPALPAAFLGLVFLVWGLAVVLGGQARDPKQAVAGAGCLVLGAVMALNGLYYVLTPIPLLVVDDAGLSYQAFPLVVQKVRWDDVSTIRAIKGREFRHGKYRRSPDLTVIISLDPPAPAAYGGRRAFYWNFSGADLPVPPEEIVQHLRRFHTVDYQDLYNRLR